MNRILSLILIAILFASCTKNKDNDPNPTNTSWTGTKLVSQLEVTTYGNNNDSTYVTYDYNNNGYLSTMTIISITYYNNTRYIDTTRLTNTYDANNKLTSRKFGGSNNSITESFTYNSNGELQQTVESSSIGQVNTKTFTYSNGKPVKIVRTSQGLTETLTLNYDNNGNITSAKYVSSASTHDTYTYDNFSYDSSKTALRAVQGHGLETLLSAFTPDQYSNNNMTTMRTTIQSNNSGSPYVEAAVRTISYHANGYPDIIEHKVSGSLQLKTYYTYQTR